MTAAFTRVVCEQPAERIDPADPGKTFIFPASDTRADIAVVVAAARDAVNAVAAELA